MVSITTQSMRIESQILMFRTLQRCLHCLSLTVLLAGCATYEPRDHYDPVAVEKVGFITSKSLAKIEPVKTKPKGNFIPVPMHGSVQMIYIPDAGRTSYRDIYEYSVKVSESETVSVLSVYSSFEVGDCAKVFLSSKPSYPRIANGSGCPAKPGKQQGGANYH